MNHGGYHSKKKIKQKNNLILHITLTLFDPVSGDKIFMLLFHCVLIFLPYTCYTEFYLIHSCRRIS